MSANIHILIVEDSPTDVLLTEEALANNRFHIQSRERLGDALQLLMSQNFDVILLDLGLPDSQGLDTLRALREKAPRIAVVVLTGKDDEELALEALKEGAQDYLVKGELQSSSLKRAIRYAVERSASENLLRESEERVRELTAHVHQVLWVMDAQEAKILYVSPGYEMVWGRTCESLLNDPTSFTRDVHPDDREMVERQNALMLQTGHIDVETRIIRPDDSIRWVWIRGYPVRKEGELVRIVGVIEDVTEHRQLAEERDALLSRLQLHIERMPLLYILFDADFRIIDWNPAAEQTLGYTREEALGLRPHDLNRPSFNKETDQILERIRAGDMTAHSVNENMTKDGRIITCEWFNTPLMLEDGHFSGLLCLGRDVTEQKLLEAQLQQAQKMEAVGQLAGGVAHDFNNLLTIISGYSEVILSKLGSDDEMRDLVKAISEAGERAASLTRQLLAFSRKTVLEPRVVDLNESVRQTEKLLRRLIGEDIILTTVLDPKINRVKIDPDQLGQVLMNLAVNARDAMPKGGKLTIETQNVELDDGYARVRSDVKPGNYVLLSMSDTGSGMTAEVIAHIFEPFFTTKGVGKGTGLGLAVVQGIVKQSGGHIEVYSEVDLGTTFKIYIPAIEEKITAPKSVELKNGGRGTESILLVEDDDGVRTLATLILQSYGYQVHAANNGHEALRFMERHQGKIELLVTDVVMPGMSGPDLAKELGASFPEMKVLFCSGYTDDAVVRHGLLEESVAFLQKPYSPRALVSKVRKVLDEK